MLRAANRASGVLPPFVISISRQARHVKKPMRQLFLPQYILGSNAPTRQRCRPGPDRRLATCGVRQPHFGEYQLAKAVSNYVLEPLLLHFLPQPQRALGPGLEAERPLGPGPPPLPQALPQPHDGDDGASRRGDDV